MSESIKRRLQALSISRDAMELRKLLNSTRTELVALRTLVNELKAKYEAHTHTCPGSTYASSRCSTPDAGAAENSLAPSEASTITAADVSESLAE